MRLQIELNRDYVWVDIENEKEPQELKRAYNCTVGDLKGHYKMGNLQHILSTGLAPDLLTPEVVFCMLPHLTQ